jgi:hypothetical protein
MTLATGFSFDKYVLLQFKSGLREQQRELQQLVQQAEQAIRELADSEPGDLADSASGYSLEGSVILNRAKIEVACAWWSLRLNAFNSARSGSATTARRRLALSAYRPFRGQAIALSAKRDVSKVILLARQARRSLSWHTPLLIPDSMIR